MCLLGRGVILYPFSLSLSLPPSVLGFPVFGCVVVCPPWLLCARVLARLTVSPSPLAWLWCVVVFLPSFLLSAPRRLLEDLLINQLLTYRIPGRA